MKRFEQLKNDGIEHGMCSKFREEWDDPSVDDVCSYFFRGMDFCIENNWPSVYQIKEALTFEEASSHGIYYADGKSIGQLQVCALGDAAVHVFVPAMTTCDIYARHKSKVHLHIGAGARCYVSMYDSSTVFVDEKGKGAKLRSSYFGGFIMGAPQFDIIHDKTKEK